MKDKLFIDSDMILDIALSRDPHFLSSSIILSFAESKTLDGYTSSVIISNLYYILRKIESHKAAVDFISKLRLIIKILPVTDEIIKFAIESKFKDFEDALQYYTAITHNIDYLITRNVKDYTRTEIRVHTPDEYIKLKSIKKRGGTSGWQRMAAPLPGGRGVGSASRCMACWAWYWLGAPPSAAFKGKVINGKRLKM
jgi:predicted nucleic acid-binding protein